MTGTCYFCGAEGESYQEQIFDHIFEALICEKCDRFSALTQYGEWVNSSANYQGWLKEHDYGRDMKQGDNHHAEGTKEMPSLPWDGL